MVVGEVESSCKLVATFFFLLVSPYQTIEISLGQPSPPSYQLLPPPLTSSTAPPAPVFTIPTSSLTTGLPVIPPPIFSTPVLHSETRTTLASVVSFDVSSPLHSTALSVGPLPKVKLPKLTLKKFNGDLTKWTPFWDSYETSYITTPVCPTLINLSTLIHCWKAQHQNRWRD